MSLSHKLLSLWPRARLIFILFLSTIVFGQANAEISDSELQRVSQSRYWKLLLHYRPRVLFGEKSHVEPSAFFLSRDGATDPLAELKASLELFNSERKVGRYQQSPQCAFPERFRYLKEEFHLQIARTPCPDLENWLEGFAADSATLVYSSAFPNNPGSTFGHNLLRINSQKKKLSKTRQDLLDYSVGYAAGSNFEGGLQFALRGLFGGFEGIIGVQPYYIKVNEYNNSESRDLWEYDLNLTPDQVNNMLRHVWELQNSAYFKYYFIDENCAYFLLVLLEIANPQWNLVDQTPWYVSPAEITKVMMDQPGAVRSVRFRPSLYKKMRAKFDRLDSHEVSQLEDILNAREIAGSNEVLDASLDLLQFKKAENKATLSKEDEALYRKLLVARAKAPESKKAQVDDAELANQMAQDSRPDQSHNSMSFGIAGGVVDGNSFEQLHFRFGLSDFVNDETGLPANSALEWLDLKVRQLQKPDRFRIESLDILRMKSLFPRTELDKKFSWGIEAKLQTPHDLNCEMCKTGLASFSGGYAWDLVANRWTTAILATAFGEFGKISAQGYRLGPSLDFENLVKFSKVWRMHLLTRAVSDLSLQGTTGRRAGFFDLLGEMAYTLSPSWDLRLNYRAIPGTPNYTEAFLGVNFDFF